MKKGPVIPKELLHQLKEKINIVDVVSESVSLRKSGREYQGLCPFHSEKTGSFYVNEGRQMYHCHGCKAGGDVFSFVQNSLNLSFLESVHWLADRVSFSLPLGLEDDLGGSSEAQAERAKKREKERLAHKLNFEVAAFYTRELQKSAEAREYFKKRGVLDPETQQNFLLGYSPAGWDGLYQHLARIKAPVELAEELQLLKKSQKLGAAPYFDLFRDRLMFPIINVAGKVIGFGGRQRIDSKESPKYLNSGDSFLYHKSRTIYGLFQAQKYIREADTVILVEGYFDVVTLHAHGIRNVVAVSGTALTTEQLQQLSRLASRIVLLFDPDRAGQEAVERSMMTGLEMGLVLQTASIPGGMDPDELVLSGPEGKQKLLEIVTHARPVVDQRIDQAIAEAMGGGPEARTRAVKTLGQLLAAFKDPTGKAVRHEYVQSKLGVSKELLEGAIAQVAQGQRRQVPVPASKAAPERKVISRSASRTVENTFPAHEQLLLHALVRWRDYGAEWEYAWKELPHKAKFWHLFTFLPAREWVGRLLAQAGSVQDFRNFSEDYLEPSLAPELRTVITEALAHEMLVYQPDDVRIALDRALKGLWGRLAQHLRKKMVEAELNKDANLQADLLKEYLDVQKKMTEFSRFYEQSE